MVRKIRFHLDESVSNAIAFGLRRRGIDVTTTAEVGLIGASDPEQIAFCLSQARILITHDDDFIKLHHSGINHCGITYCNQKRRSIGEILNTLNLIWQALEPEDMKNQLEFL
jgi:predicted nuclease of predicted toxin-antitoxin system